MNKPTLRPVKWLMILMLVAAPSFLGAAQIKLKVTAELANIRLKPSISSVIIRQIPQGEILEAVRQEGEWYLVKLDPDESGNASGYVHESLVLPLEEIPKTERKAQVVEPPVKTEKEPARKPKAGLRETEAEAGGEGAVSAWSFTISGGGNYADGGDLNKAAQGLADYFGNQLSAAADATVRPARLSFMFGGEAATSIFPWLEVAVGADFFSSSKLSDIVYGSGEGAPAYSAKPRFQAVPISFSLKIYPQRSVYLKLGTAFYIASCGYFYRFENGEFWQEWNGEADARAFGYFGGLGIDMNLSESIALVLEAIAHYAPIKGFTGTGTYQDSTLAEPISEDGTVYAYDASIKGQTSFPLLLIRSQRPAEGYVVNVREATLDFSGVSLRLGVKIRL